MSTSTAVAATLPTQAPARPVGTADAWRRQGAAPREARFISREEEVALVRRAQAGDRGALERLVESNIRLIYREAQRYRCRSHSHEDLIQEGVLGLIVAVERFDAGFGCRLSTYAMHWVRQAIARAAEQNDRLIHVPLQCTADLRRLLKLREEQQRRLGRTPTEAELAEASGLPEDRVVQLLGTVQETVSLETLVGSGGDSPLIDMAEDPNATDPEQDAMVGVFRQQLRRLVETLRPRERQVVEERFGFRDGTPRTLDDLSRQLRISRERVRQIEAGAMRKLRHALSSGQWD